MDVDGVLATLDAVDRLHRARTEADATLFVLATRFADQHAAETVLPIAPLGGRGRLGGERAVVMGGAGTPRVAEFAIAELGARMGMGTWSARRYVADALDVRHRLPLIWARLVAGEARVGSARLVATRTRHLSVEAAAWVDAAMVGCVDGSLPWGRFEARLDGKVVAADPETAAAREAERVAVQFAKRTRSSENGTAGFYVRSTVGVIARLDATVVYVADALKAFGDGDDLDTRKVKAILVLCNPARAVELLAAYAAMRSRTVQEALDVEAPPTSEPPAPSEPDALDRMDAFASRVGFEPTRLPTWLAPHLSASDPGPPGGPPEPHPRSRPVFTFDWSKLLPPLTLYLHLAVDPDRQRPPDLPATAAEHVAGGVAAGGVVRWEGDGPVTERFVHDHLRPLHSYVIQPVIDLAHQAPVDAYEVPDRHRQAVHLRTPADAFPYSSNTTRDVDIDHTEPYRPPPDGSAPPGTSRSVAERRWLSRLENYAPLGRFHHRLKTHGHWTVRQPFDGIVLWRDPHGQVYLVDHTGTHRVTQSDRPAGAVRRSDPAVHLYPATTAIELDLTPTA